MESRYADYCLALIQGLCRESEVKIVKTQDEMGVLLTAEGIVKSDMGNVIGRQGAHINAVRLLVRVVSTQENARVSVKIAEPEGYENKKPATIGTY